MSTNTETTPMPINGLMWNVVDCLSDAPSSSGGEYDHETVAMWAATNEDRLWDELVSPFLDACAKRFRHDTGTAKPKGSLR